MTQSFIFDWSRVSDFWNQWNKKFQVSAMNGANNFQLVVASYCGENIDDCIFNGILLPTVTVATTLDCGLVFDGETIRLSDTVQWTLNTTVSPVKAIFLRDKQTGYVLGYSIANTSFEVTNKLLFDKDMIFWSFEDG